VESRFVVQGANSADGLAALIEWFRHENGLGGRIRVDRSGPEPGEMGSLTDVVAVALGGGGALTALANSLLIWLRQPRRFTVRLAVVRPDGTTVEITADNLPSVDDAEELLRRCAHPGED